MTHRTFLVIVLLTVAIVAGLIMMFASSDSTGQMQQRLSARQTTTLKLIADGQKNLTDDNLAKLNSELNIVLLGDDREIQDALKAAGLKKVEKAVIADESDTETFSQLKTAKLNAQYDATYRRVLAQKLEALRSLLEELHGATKIKGLKPSLAKEYQHLGTYLESLNKLEN